MAKDRAKDARRTVGSHQEMMGALGRASGWRRAEGFALPGKDKSMFTPGHGNVNVGTRSYYEPSELSTIKELGRVTNRSAGINPEKDK